MITGIDPSEIKTPKSAPHQYSPEWRLQMAAAALQDQYRMYSIDPDDYIRLQIDFLEGSQSRNRVMNRLYDSIGAHPESKECGRLHVKVANDIYDDTGQGTCKAKLEALLLCPELTMTEIGSLLSLDMMIVKYYERVFYNIRDDKGLVLASPWLREFFATNGAANDIQPNDFQAYWKLLAFETGHTGLLSNWGWPVNPSIPEKEMATIISRNVYRDLEKRTRFGTMGARDLVALFGHLQANLQDLRDRGLLSGERVDDDSLLLEVLAASGPSPQIPSDEKLQEKAGDISAKIEMIKKQDSTHKGESQETLDSISGQVELIKQSG